MARRFGSVGDHAEDVLGDPLPVRLGMDASESDIHVCVCCFLKRNWGSFGIGRATNTTLDSKQQRFWGNLGCLKSTRFRSTWVAPLRTWPTKVGVFRGMSILLQRNWGSLFLEEHQVQEYVQ